VKNGSATVTIDEAGRIPLPEDMREAAHLEPGTEVRVTLHIDDDDENRR
jgi:bifunctional DNA-binding transcriptional regulator/antitoxin component of YhaV-PrlF toxin-antitoxin module